MTEENEDLSTDDIEEGSKEPPFVEDEVIEKDVTPLEAFEKQKEIIAEALENSQPITEEQVMKAKIIVDKLLSSVCRFDEKQLIQYCEEYQLDVRGVDYHSFDQSFLETSSARSYLIRQEKLVLAYLKWIDKCYDLLSAFILLNSPNDKKKTGDIKKAEVVVKLQDIYFKKQVYEDLLFNVQGKREAVEAARDDLSRVLGYWQNRENLSPGRSIQVDRKR